MKQYSTIFHKKIKRSEYSSLALQDGARVAVMGGGPAGSLFAYFLMDLAQRAGLSLQVDNYEPRDFSLPGPRGCNMCAGILSESLIQMLAVDGVNFPPMSLILWDMFTGSASYQDILARFFTQHSGSFFFGMPDHPFFSGG
jgi:hypothetical protein